MMPRTRNGRATRSRKHDVFAALGDPTRRRVLDLLSHGSLPVKRIAVPFAMTRPAVSQHLRILHEAGLVDARRAGRERLYSLRAAPLREVYDWICHYERFWRTRLKTLGRYLDREEARK